MTLAHYKCCKCGYEYYCPPEVIRCWECGWLYVEWVNYNEMFGNRILELEYLEEL